MVTVPQIDVAADDMRQESIRQGFDPDKWHAFPAGNGAFDIRKGAFSVGNLLFEDHARILVDALNALLEKKP